MQTDRAAEVEVVVECEDVASEVAACAERGYVVEMIRPADAPREAVVVRGRERLRLRARGEPRRVGLRVPEMRPELVVARARDAVWTDGRAGMAYRDLIPGRLGGRYVASQIRIARGGPVADWVHWHEVRFQLIFCVHGSARVVYEDHGAPFEMHRGDCVLQPPGIRHRVLECSDGLEVVEVSCPADHATFSDRRLELPNDEVVDEILLDGQRFVRHVAALASWSASQEGVDVQDTGIAAATDGLVDVRVVRWTRNAERNWRRGELRFAYVLSGGAEVDVAGERFELARGDACTVPPDRACKWTRAAAGAEVLVVTARG